MRPYDVKVVAAALGAVCATRDPRVLAIESTVEADTGAHNAAIQQYGFVCKIIRHFKTMHDSDLHPFLTCRAHYVPVMTQTPMEEEGEEGRLPRARARERRRKSRSASPPPLCEPWYQACMTEI